MVHKTSNVGFAGTKEWTGCMSHVPATQGSTPATRCAQRAQEMMAEDIKIAPRDHLVEVAGYRRFSYFE